MVYPSYIYDVGYNIYFNVLHKSIPRLNSEVVLVYKRVSWSLTQGGSHPTYKQLLILLE